MTTVSTKIKELAAWIKAHPEADLNLFQIMALNLEIVHLFDYDVSTLKDLKDINRQTLIYMQVRLGVNPSEALYDFYNEVFRDVAMGQIAKKSTATKEFYSRIGGIAGHIKKEERDHGVSSYNNVEELYLVKKQMLKAMLDKERIRPSALRVLQEIDLVYDKNLDDQALGNYKIS